MKALKISFLINNTVTLDSPIYLIDVILRILKETSISSLVLARMAWMGIFMDCTEIGRHEDGLLARDVKNSLKNYTDQFLQVGVAPYLGAYGDFHTWIMIKTKKNTLLGDWSTFPVLKFFKGNFLIEFGYNNQTEWDAHVMYRF